MVYLVKKINKGNIYLYLAKSARVNGKSKIVWQQYLGPEKDIGKLSENISAYIETNDVEVQNFGLPMLLLMIAEKIDLVKIIDSITDKREQGLSVGEYMLIATINRCIKPISKTKIKQWFDSTCLKDQFKDIDTYLDSNAYTNHFAYLTEEKIEAIELEINKKLISEFNIDISNVYYDPTNYYTFINPKKQLLPRHGKSKEGRYNLNLINLSIFCNDNGIPIMHHTYPGNIQDATQFKTEYPKFLQRMKKVGLDVSTLTLVFDKGNISEEVFNEIEASEVNFICSIRPSTQKDLHDLKGEDFEIFTLPNGSEVGLKKYRREMYGERYPLIVAYNPNRNKWNRSIKFEKIEKKVDLVKEYFEDRLNTHKWRDRNNVVNKIIALIKNKKYFDFIDYTVTGDYGELVLDIGIKDDILEDHLNTLGKSYYMTNRIDLSSKDIVWAYRQQYTVEHAFKNLKRPNFFQIRPMFHSKDTSIRGHVFTVVLSLLLTSLLHKEVRKQFPVLSFMETINYLSEIDLVVIELKNRSIRKIAKMSPEAQMLSNYFNLKQYL